MNSALAKVICFNLVLSVGVRDKSKDGLTFSFIRHYVNTAKKPFPSTSYIYIHYERNGDKLAHYCLKLIHYHTIKLDILLHQILVFHIHDDSEIVSIPV
jgi:hypothetical protein